ncbi:MAG: hypothetical protein U0822_05480 [Anaerolineae bacterium]
MRALSTRVIVSMALALSLAVTLAGLAQAHERRDVGGKYRLVVGWDGEPAYAGQRNAVSLNVTNLQTNTPVEGAEKDLKLEIIQGAQKRVLPLRAVFRQPGAYVADVVPTKEGDYRFHFFGAIEGTPIDEMFDSADGKFDGVQSPQAILFPGDASSATQPAAAVPAAVNAVAAQPTAPPAANAVAAQSVPPPAANASAAQSVPPAAANASASQPALAAPANVSAAQPANTAAVVAAVNNASTAQTLAVVALVVALLSLLMGLLALLRSRSESARRRGDRAVTSQK